MKLSKLLNKIILLLTAITLLYSCIEDNITPPLNGELNKTAEMLTYIVEHGDFANSTLAPALVNAEEVYSNRSLYLIVDIRQASDFAAGHIEGSVNVTTDSLYKYFESLNTNVYDKIILVSKNGQSSAYFTCLLRLAGFNNVYTMNFGLASWNEFFADEWFNAIGDYPDFPLTNITPEKNNFTPLPELIFKNPNAPTEEHVKERISKIISEGFKQGIQYRDHFSLSIDDYLICYGIYELYSAFSPGHGIYPLAILYRSDPTYELRAERSLQTLPTNRTTFIYDENGQLAACMAAYLRVLGYDVVTLLFGSNQLIYSSMITEPSLIPFAFDNSDIMNYPYVTGE